MRRVVAAIIKNIYNNANSKRKDRKLIFLEGIIVCTKCQNKNTAVALIKTLKSTKIIQNIII
jgi:hypothetical protein